MATLLFRSFLLLVLLFQVLSAAGDSFWNVKYLPGFSGPLPFELETGYIGVGDSEEVQLFYYFVKSQRNPQTDPLMTWYIGGPGCSAFSGFVFEIGPLNFKIEPLNGSLPQLILNPHTWTKEATISITLTTAAGVFQKGKRISSLPCGSATVRHVNSGDYTQLYGDFSKSSQKASILFVDSPVDTGFSYSRSLHGLKMGDHIQVKQNHQFLRKWLTIHPEFISNPFYVGGDSYSGIIIPPLTQAISKGNKHDFPVINLQGYVEGNPLTIRKTSGNLRIPFARSKNLISNELYESITSSCDGEYLEVDINNGRQLTVDTDNEECIKDVATFEKSVEGINIRCTLWAFCPPVSSAPQSQAATSAQRRSLYNNNTPKVLPPIYCQEYGYYLVYYWANNDQVRKALHISEGSKGEWVRCKNHRAYEYEIMNVVPYHVNLSSIGYRSLIFSGDHDMLVSTMDTEVWIKSLNYSIIDDWRHWIDRHQVLGYTRTYANNMTFATIKDGGHTPEYTQYQSGIMFERWIAGKSL